MDRNRKSTMVVENLAAKWFAPAVVVCLMTIFNLGCQNSVCTVDEDCHSPSLVCRNNACVADIADLSRVAPPADLATPISPADLAVAPAADVAVPPDLIPEADLFSCPLGQTACNGVCTNLQLDPAHCGACGTVCDPNTQKCVAGACANLPPTCTDGVKNGGETDTDCGGPCKGCGNGKPCNADGDCANGLACLMGVCAKPVMPDLAQAADLTMNPDLATPADLANNQGADGGMAADLLGGAVDLSGNQGGGDLSQAQPKFCDLNQGLKDCGGNVCTDISSDGKNCGGCSNACPQGSVCSFFSCFPACKPGETNCSGSCTDVQTDGRNCGGCGNSCAAKGLFCVNGKCANACLPGQDVCGLQGCVDKQTDQFNCGGCNKACAPNMVCQGGVCVGCAQQNRKFCNGACVDINNETMNCGGCGIVCIAANATPYCSSGSCKIWGCFGKFQDCNNLFGDGCEVNTATNLTHCGQCGNTCPAVANGTRACLSGSCGIGACNAGFADCNLSPKDGCEVTTTSDVLNCGACGKACQLFKADSKCVNSTCDVDTCDFGFANCNKVAADGCEVNMGTDTKNCGKCGFACQQGQMCVYGLCTNAGCGNLTQCGNVCVNTNTDTSNCGGCGKVCQQGQACVNGACQVQQACQNQKTLVVKTGWQFQGSKGPDNGLGKGIPNGPWVSIGQILSWCVSTLEKVAFNVQSYPAENIVWLVVGDWRPDPNLPKGGDWCANMREAFDPHTIFQGKTPLEMGCKFACLGGFPNYLCDLLQ